MPQNKLRSSLTPLPGKMLFLDIDEAGYPVLWNKTLFPDLDRKLGRIGLKHFGASATLSREAMSSDLAIREWRCWACGGRMGRHVTFIDATIAALTHVTPEPPSHLECARWVARNARTNQVAMLWGTERFAVTGKTDTGRPLLTMGEPDVVEWYALGEEAGREEVEESLNGALAYLEKAMGGDVDMSKIRQAGMSDANMELHELIRSAKAVIPWLPEKKLVRLARAI